jgi:hypothetical protein
MKKTFLILGIILLIIVGAVWAYLFLYGVPQSTSEIFARFQNSPSAHIPRGGESESTVDVAPTTGGGERQRLRQLTTRPVAGAIALTDTMRYVERGTGHVYDINLKTGIETIVSGTTIPKTIRAIFSIRGDSMALTTITPKGEAIIVGGLKNTNSGGGFEGNTLPPHAREAAFTDASSTLHYYLPGVQGGTAYAYNLLTKKSVELFTTPLTDVRILWGKDTYLYTTPSALQQGYVYKIEGKTLSYLTQGAYAQSALRYNEGIIITQQAEEGLTSIDYTHQAEIPAIALMPEKCVASHSEKGMLFCGAPTSFDTQKKYPDDWYKGTVSFSDVLFKVNAPSSTVQVIADLEGESGRAIDIATIGVSPNGTLLYFINKNDNALWVFDTTVPLQTGD